MYLDKFVYMSERLRPLRESNLNEIGNPLK